MRPADLKYYTKTRDFTDVHVIGGRKAFASHNPVSPHFPYTLVLFTTPAAGRMLLMQCASRRVGS